MEIKYLADYNKYDEHREDKEFWEHLWKEIDTWSTENMKENEKKVLEAIKILLSSPDDIEIFNKKAIYLYIREITGLNTKQYMLHWFKYYSACYIGLNTKHCMLHWLKYYSTS